ncbi:FkbM family methyltransferase [Actinomycetospora sp. TBRC 11914]|uniref:FkbM family methyltransferase n=1 Tax=Actinomycetospora sp. TBRC 11914 TaxID=2729387 RepID=UPI00145D3103|nr:FkbM family methyltransferase [Actinomycetospora sp. TBRC 11914]NMO92974.1 FkbM family methyltransferase [Actinomycetospora sp. TBRC 11914]
MIDFLNTPQRLGPLRRARVLARRSLDAGLRVVPDKAVALVHDRWIDADGVRSPTWRVPARVLYYRSLDAEWVEVPGGEGERLVVAGTRLERVLWWYGEAGYEQAEAQCWRRLCAGARDVLELGANVGYYSVVGARACPGRYTAVEPAPEAAAVARHNLALNGLSGVDVVEAAVVGAHGPDEVELAFPDQESHQTAPTGSFLREGTEQVGHRAATTSVRVPTVPAAELFAGRDLVKLDIEGSEATVLEAAADEVRRSRPIVLVEVLAGAARLHRVIAELLADGWTAVHPTGDLPEMSPAELTAPRDRDVLLVPRERRGAI